MGQRSDSCPLRNKLSVLECVQKSSCTLRLQLQLIDFQPGTTSIEPYATGLKPTRVLGAPAVGGGETSNKTSARRRSCWSDERRRCFTVDPCQGWSSERFPLHQNRDEKDPLQTVYPSEPFVLFLLPPSFQSVTGEIS